jgi:ribose 1,5-bisphosphokinase
LINNHLVIVIGPSGSGKDTLIAGAKKALSGNPDFYFARREITRPLAPGSEQHIAVSEETFQHREKTGAYAISWHAHGTWYGIRQSIEDNLADGKVVVFNGSRAAIEDAKKRFPGIRIIFITAPDNILAERLTARARESGLQVSERMLRNRQLATIPDGATVLTNTGSIAQTLDEFISILKNTVADRSEPVKNFAGTGQRRHAV